MGRDTLEAERLMRARRIPLFGSAVMRQEVKLKLQ